MTKRIPVTLDSDKPPFKAIFVVEPRPPRIDTRRLMRMVYRAIRMGWKPDNKGLWWSYPHYQGVLDCLPPDITVERLNRFKTLYHRQQDMVEFTYHHRPQTFVQAYQWITGEESHAKQPRIHAHLVRSES